MSLYNKILDIQKVLQGIKPDKDCTNYSYVTGEKLLSIIRPKMDELGLILKQEIVGSTREHVVWKTKYSDKQQTMVNVKFRFTWIDVESEETDVTLFEADGFNDWDKAIGSAMTYGERYFFMKQFHIPEDYLDPNLREDIGKIAKPTEEQGKTIKGLREGLSLDLDDVVAIAEKDYKSWDKADADMVIERLEKLKKDYKGE